MANLLKTKIFCFI